MAFKSSPVGPPGSRDSLNIIFSLYTYREEIGPTGRLSPVERLMSQEIQSVTALVRRLSLKRIMCSAHLIFNILACGTASLILDRLQRSELRILSLIYEIRDTPSIDLLTARSITPCDLSSCLRSDQVFTA
ncbi:hypothetical protein KIN20_010649 [Parelaphostrongylus tenuis]|uniref:Uncharacterized protein n=1 Tax=Parelaphostrongylus tenuis TaxID=148309 RepID=A0AAD5M864_PARTN|nr:hypothetical protein KIN20_010649 [Parelaphostrongylus tenuis]